MTLDDLKALPDDALIEKVAEFMGWNLHKVRDSDFATGNPRVWFEDEQGNEKNPLRNWNHTMEVVERMAKVTDPLIQKRFMFWVCDQIPAGHDFSLFADQRIICRAALLAVSPSSR